MKMQSVLAAKGPRVVTIGPNDSVGDAVARLSAENVGVLVVVNDTFEPVGVLSERDVIRHLANGEAVLHHPVEDLMTHDVVTCSPSDDLESILQTMTSRHFRHMPILEEGKLVGLVTLGDLVKAQLAEFRGAVENLENQVMTS